LKILLLNESGQRQPRAFLEKWVRAVEKELAARQVLSREARSKELTLVFLDPASAKKLNWEFRGKDYATDVLSFAPVEEDSFGELVMCPQVLKRQALENKHPYQQEVAYMILHGFLHLLGYDHETSPAAAEKMFQLQDSVFEKLLAK
jgi:probable rRNA maturation factor